MRCTASRLLRSMGLRGVIRGKKVIPTNPDKGTLAHEVEHGIQLGALGTLAQSLIGKDAVDHDTF